MRRTLATGLIGVLIIGALVALLASGSSRTRTYRIELDNAFGIVTGADFKVAGIKAGTIKSIDLDRHSLHAVVTVSITQKGVGQFHSDAFCVSRPQSLIGEYFISCDPGTSGQTLPSGATIGVAHTQSTIPADLLQNIMRLPYRQRFSLIIGELGAAAAGRSSDLQAALARAVPALTQTDNLLALLGNDSTTLQQLTASSDAVVTALANNADGVKRFIVQANRAAGDTAVQDTNLQATFAKLPGFLAQLRPAMARLGQATDANTPALRNLNASAVQLDRLFTLLPSFSRVSLPAIRALGQTSLTGRSAVIAATPTIQALSSAARNTPELARNLAIVTQHIDNRKYAVEKNPRSPGGQGYTGLESLLQFAFNLAAATNYYGPYGHMLAVDAFASPMCSSYASKGTVVSGLKQYGAAYRTCYAGLGPNQPGVNTIDPSNPTGCVPDPGGVAPGGTAPTANLGTACTAAPSEPARTHKGVAPTHATGAPTALPKPGGLLGTVTGTTGRGGIAGILSGLLGGDHTGGTGVSGVVGGVLGSISGGGSGASSGGTLGAGAAGAAGGAGVPATPGAVTKHLLQYLIAP